MDNRRDEVVQIARSIKDLTEADVLIELTKLKKIDIEKLPLLNTFSISVKR